MKQQESAFTVDGHPRDGVCTLTVGQLNRMAGRLLQETFGLVRVEGELSNVTRAASGHWYFTLKEGGAAVRAVMFRMAAQRVDFRPAEGDRVTVDARVTLYEARGDFQLGVERMQRAGQGDVWQRFARLKALLAAEGLFDPGHKQLLPSHPRRLGIVSSLKAAALQDVLTTLRRRAPHLHVILYPAPVQGQQAPAGLIQAIDVAERRQECDVLLVVRGGGSFEDLDAFNHEGLVRRLARCTLPVVTGIGHESDFTLCDFVADVRAATPTAAAELVSPDGQAARQHLRRQTLRLQQAVQRHLGQLAQRLDMAERLLRSPGQQMQHQHARLDRLADRLQQVTRGQLAQAGQRWTQASARLAPPDVARAQARLQQGSQRLAHVANQCWQAAAHRLALAETSLGLISPLAVLSRGYAIVRGPDGQVLRAPAETAIGERLDVQLAEGHLHARVEENPEPDPLPRPQVL